MEVPRLMMHLMPPATIVSDFVNGIQNCNYENYLRELVNSSLHFTKRGRSSFSAPASEDHGQCDAISRNYELDFKLLIAQTAMQAASILRLQPLVVENGVTFYTESKCPDGQVEVTMIHAVLHDLSTSELEQVRAATTEKGSLHNDIVSVLKTAETKKNLLFLFPYTFEFESFVYSDSAVESIRHFLRNAFSSLFLYRAKKAPDFDTYLTVRYSGSFLLFCYTGRELHYVESIPDTEMPTYLELSQYDGAWT